MGKEWPGFTAAILGLGSRITAIDNEDFDNNDLKTKKLNVISRKTTL